MIHRSRRLATLPARRGMRASWLRCRIPDELDGAVQNPPGAPEPGPPAEEDAIEPGAGLDAPPTVAAIRPAFGRPTF